MKRLPLTYLISDGSTKSGESASLVRLVQAAVEAGVDYVQIREKHLSSAQLFELTSAIVSVTVGSKTRVLVNDRVDVAVAAGADGVHLTEVSVPVRSIRRQFGPDLLIGISTHSLDGVAAARDGEANFIVFGPVFPTSSKPEVSDPVGLTALSEAVTIAGSVPVLALGGVNLNNSQQCLATGAAGIAGISLYRDPARLTAIVSRLRKV